MKNKEKYANEIADIACSGELFAVDKKTSKVMSCRSLACADCLFVGNGMIGCVATRKKWAASEHKEPLSAKTIYDEEIIRCKDCKHQKKWWCVDNRMKDKGYFIYGCNLIDDSFVGTPVWGENNQFCSSAEPKGGADTEQEASE